MDIVIDLDGTIANNDHRADFAAVGNWDEYRNLESKDVPYADVQYFINLIGFLSVDYEHEVNIILITGRHERYRVPTERWLRENELNYDHMFMRPNLSLNDFEMKIDLLERFYEGKENLLSSVAFVLEDSEKAVEGFRNYGLNVWQVRLGVF